MADFIWLTYLYLWIYRLTNEMSVFDKKKEKKWNEMGVSQLLDVDTFSVGFCWRDDLK